MLIKNVEIVHVDDSEARLGDTIQNPSFTLDIPFYPKPGAQLPFTINGYSIFCVEFNWDINTNEGYEEITTLIYDYIEFDDNDGSRVVFNYNPDLTDEEPISNVISVTFGEGKGN